MFTIPPFSLSIQAPLRENKWNKKEKTHQLRSRYFHRCKKEKKKKHKWDYSSCPTGRPAEQWPPWKTKLHWSLPLPIFIPEHINHCTVWNIPLASLGQLWLSAPMESWVWLHQVPAGFKHCSSDNGHRISVLTLNVQKRHTKQLMVKLPTPGGG